MDEIGIEQARGMLGEIVDRAHWSGLPTRITRQGKSAAVIVSAAWHDAVLDALGDYEVNHKDGDPRNNDPANLEIMPRPERNAGA